MSRSTSLRSWLGLPPSADTPRSESATSAKKPKLERNSSSSRSVSASSRVSTPRTPWDANRKSAVQSERSERHPWGNIVRNSTWPQSKTETGASAFREKPREQAKASEIFQPYTSHFLWPQGDYARWPGSGDYAFDSIRRAKIVKQASSYGVQLKRVLRCEVWKSIEEVAVPLEIYLNDADIDILALFYYKRRIRWTRLDRLGDIDRDSVQRLVNSGTLSSLSRDESCPRVLASAYSLLTIDELRGLLRARPAHKAQLVMQATKNHKRIFDSLCDLTGGIVSLDRPVHDCLLRLHQIVFAHGNFEPEDATEYLISGIMGSVKTPFCSADPCSLEELTVDKLLKPCQKPERCLDCWGNLKQSLDQMGIMAHFVTFGDSAKVFHALHIASTLLLETSKACNSLDHGWCWMNTRTLEHCLRIILLGISLMERERRYEDALHYLRVALGALEARCVLDVDDEDPKVDPRISFHRARLLHRYCVDLGHLDRKNEALLELERVLSEPNSIIWSAGSPCRTVSDNRIGGVGAGLILMFHRLSEPPRRWKPKLSVALHPFPEERICVERIEGESVETLSANYYLRTGIWTQAQHCENGIVHTMFGLVFASEDNDWLDLNPFDDFVFRQDKSNVAKVLARVAAGEAPEMIKYAWNKYHGRQMRGVNWTRNSLDDLLMITRNLGANVVVLICQLLADAYEAWSGGVPDLLLWNDTKVRFVEIKGPGDSLSDRQRAWGEKLHLAGADITVCYVSWLNKESETAGQTPNAPVPPICFTNEAQDISSVMDEMDHRTLEDEDENGGEDGIDWTYMSDGDGEFSEIDKEVVDLS